VNGQSLHAFSGSRNEIPLSGDFWLPGFSSPSIKKIEKYIMSFRKLQNKIIEVLNDVSHNYEKYFVS
jgi:hypothetical protein